MILLQVRTVKRSCWKILAYRLKCPFAPHSAKYSIDELNSIVIKKII